MILGQAIALAFAKAGAAKLVIASRSAKRLEATERELLKINPNVDVLVLPTDTTSEDSVNNLEEVVRSKFGIPDVLVNGAGLWSSVETIGDSKPKEWWADFVSPLSPGHLIKETHGSTESRKSMSKETTS